MSTPEQPRELSPKAKLAVEGGPLLVLGATFILSKLLIGDGRELIYGTGAFIVATLFALGYSYMVERKVSMVALVTAILVTALGGLTIYLDDDTFIKQKPTYVSGLIGSVLLIGLAFGRPFVKYLMQGAVQLEEAGWHKLTLRWGFFMLLLAGLNEVVWRNFSTETWLSYKLFGILPLTIVFLLSQGPLIAEYAIEQPMVGADDQNETPSSD